MFIKAWYDYAAAVEHDPSNDWSLDRFAWLLATCPDQGCRNGRFAVRFAGQEDAIAATDDDAQREFGDARLADYRAGRPYRAAP